MKKPMLAASRCLTEEDLQSLQYPMYATPKIDGIRMLTQASRKKVQGYSRVGKLLRNIFLQEFCEDLCTQLDGEVVVVDPVTKMIAPFQATSSFVMSEMQWAKDFKYYLFDHTGYRQKPYLHRYDVLQNQYYRYMSNMPNVEVLLHKEINSPEELMEYYRLIRTHGHEGLIIRNAGSWYKSGRATFASQSMLKMKERETEVAQIVRIEPWQRNSAESKANEIGYAHKSKKQQDKVTVPMLGAFVVETKQWGQFAIGSGQGLTVEYRKRLWNNRDRLIGHYLSFSYHVFNTKDKPREPIFLGLVG